MNTRSSLLLVLLLAGCVGMGQPVNDKQASQIKAGVTTKDELIKAFGPPRYTGLESTSAGSHQTMTWLYQPLNQMGAIMLGVRRVDAQLIHVVLGTNDIVETLRVDVNRP